MHIFSFTLNNYLKILNYEKKSAQNLSFFAKKNNSL